LWILLESKPPSPETRKKLMKKYLLAVRLLAAPTPAQAPAQEQAEIALHACARQEVTG